MTNLLITWFSRVLTILNKKAFENIVEKGENAGNQHFLLFPQTFLHLNNIYIVVLKCI